jgi:MFS family permease
MPLRLGARGWSPAEVGWMLTTFAAAMAVSAPASGFLVDRTGSRGPATLSLIVAAAALLSIGWSGTPRIASLVVFGAAAGMFVTANTAGVMNSAPPAARGAVASWVALARNAGMAAGSVVGTFAYGRMAARLGGSDPAGQAFAIATTIAAAAAATGAAISYAGHKRPLPLAAHP